MATKENIIDAFDTIMHNLEAAYKDLEYLEKIFWDEDNAEVGNMRWQVTIRKGALKHVKNSINTASLLYKYRTMPNYKEEENE